MELTTNDAYSQIGYVVYMAKAVTNVAQDLNHGLDEGNERGSRWEMSRSPTAARKLVH